MGMAGNMGIPDCVRNNVFFNFRRLMGVGASCLVIYNDIPAFDVDAPAYTCRFFIDTVERPGSIQSIIRLNIFCFFMAGNRFR